MPHCAYQSICYGTLRPGVTNKASNWLHYVDIEHT
jgi:hypothetical protein